MRRCPNPHYVPVPVEEAVENILKHKPDVLFHPHTETSVGMMVSDDYMRKIADAVHSYGGIYVLDGVASGPIWTDMKKLGHDVYITAP